MRLIEALPMAEIIEGKIIYATDCANERIG